jgi:transglutaminase/protease-like cytokinesis protein 3
VRTVWAAALGILAVLLAVVGCAGSPPVVARGAATHLAVSPPVAPVAPAVLEPVVAAMTRSDETSIAAVAQAIAAATPDRRRRIKALHDWVADRLEYDDVESPLVYVVSFAPSGVTDLYSVCAIFPTGCPPRDAWGLPPLLVLQPPSGRDPTDMDVRDQLAERAFVRRRGVCAHYAALLQALGAAIGEDIRYVHGRARTRDGKSGRHAWNMARMGDHYEPIDVTWDSGYGEGGGFHRHYSDEWLFVPSTTFLATHFPDKDG